MSPTVFRYRNYRFYFFSREEPRMHVHVISPDGEAKFWLEPKIELAVNQGLGATELNELTKIIEERQNEIRDHWRRHFRAEVLNVSPHGFWLFVAGKEFFLSFDDFPWFRKAPIEQLFNIQFSHGHHLHWPDLEVDLDLARIEHPEMFPLVAQVG